jgi:hypothetical protein
MKKDNKQRLFEVLGKIDPTFKPNAKLLTEWNFDKKKGDVDKEDKKEDKDEKKETPGKKKWNFEKKGEDKETPEHEESETPAEEEKEEGEDKKELKEVESNVGKKVPVTCWDKAKVGSK